MKEAQKPKYLFDGFLIKHYGIYPTGFDKNNLFEEQKIFFMYLMGCVPSVESWTAQVKYETKLEKIQQNTKVELSDTDIDLCKLRGESIEKLRSERLVQEKKKQISELNKKFGIKDSENTEKVDILPPEMYGKKPPKQLWDMLQGKGIIKNGLQHKDQG